MFRVAADSALSLAKVASASCTCASGSSRSSSWTVGVARRLVVTTQLGAHAADAPLCLRVTSPADALLFVAFRRAWSVSPRCSRGVVVHLGVATTSLAPLVVSGTSAASSGYFRDDVFEQACTQKMGSHHVASVLADTCSCSADLCLVVQHTSHSHHSRGSLSQRSSSHVPSKCGIHAFSSGQTETSASIPMTKRCHRTNLSKPLVRSRTFMKFTSNV